VESTNFFPRAWLHLGAFALGGLIAMGWAGQVADAHLDGLVHVKPYSFGTSSCLANDYRDPITVVFKPLGSNQNVQYHGQDHNWSVGSGSPFIGSQAQYFYQHGCLNYQGQFASGFAWQNRYHLRLVVHNDPSEPSMGWYSISTPHYEIVTCGGSSHAVSIPSEWSFAPSGFVAARWEIGYQWHNWNNGGRHHTYLGAQYWGNNTQMQQCNGQWHGSDGWVDFVEVLGPYPI